MVILPKKGDGFFPKQEKKDAPIGKMGIRSTEAFFRQQKK